MPLPGPELSNRPLHFIWICDCSGSMSGQKIESLNTAIRNAIPEMQREADNNPNVQLLVRSIIFSTGAQWHIAQPTPIEDFKWTDLKADGVTDMGKALAMIAEQLKLLSDRAFPPVLVLISDGQPTDDFNSGLKQLMEEDWGKKAVRIAIAVGSDVDYEPLQKFIGHSELKPLQANNPEDLVRQIKWASTVVVRDFVTKPIINKKDGPPIPAALSNPDPDPDPNKQWLW
jgi:uncharacterized protein YegL